jgi:steroid delta-isomerase-like uncharacterized protein
MKKHMVILAVIIFALAGCTSNPLIPEIQGKALLAVWESGSVQDLVEIMAENSVYEAVQQGYVYKGIDEIKGYVGHVRLFASDLSVEVISIKSTKTMAFLEWEMTGIQSQPIPGRVVISTNRKFSIRGITLVEVQDGLITKATDYMDVLGFVVQLGGRVELPGGIVIGEE